MDIQAVNKCEHGVYRSPGDEKSWGCQICYPAGHPEVTQSPVLPRSSADVLTRESARENCIKCGNLRTYFAPSCRHCGESFPEIDSRSITSQQNTRMNPGACPECRSAIHYATKKKSVWCCADCGVEYKAPKNYDEL